MDQIKTLIYNAFSPIFGYEVDYFIGQDSNYTERMLCFEIKSKRLGNIYKKTLLLPKGSEIYMYEADFIGTILSDFIMLGTRLITNQILEKRDKPPQTKSPVEVLNKPFTKGKLNKLNLN